MEPPQDRFMRRAIELSIENVRSARGGPFAAVIVRDGEVVSEGTNLVTSSSDPTAHAEIVAIRRASSALGQFELRDCDIYCSCEPCPMCLGAIYWARLARLFYGGTREDAASIGFDDSLIYSQVALPPELRRIPTIQMMHAEALAPFREWERNPHKVPY
jgi:guanine deaminase